MMYSAPLLTTLVTVLPLVAANCTTFTDVRSLADTGSSFSNQFFTPLDILACPYNATTNCMIARKTYDITVRRQLNISVSEANADNIFALAQKFYAARPDFTAPPFITREGNISSASISNIFIEVAPGKNKTLGWTSFMYYSFGNLGNCTNSSLEGVGVRTAAPYLMNGTSGLVLAGTFSASTVNISNGTGGKDNSASRPGGSAAMSAVIVGIGALVFALIL